MKKIIFICTGNTCRSSMAEGIFKELIKDESTLKDMEVTSAGTDVYFSEGANKNAIEALKQMGIDIGEHKAKSVTYEMLEQADLILSMTQNHKLRLLGMSPKLKDKIFTLKEYISGDNCLNSDISDPYGMPLERYKLCADELREYLIKLKEKLSQETGERKNS